MNLILASRNKKKIKEMEAILATHFPGIHILSLDDVGYVGDIEENGETFEENALTKARVAAASGYIGIADDSGLSVDALGGEPGVYSARYAARALAQQGEPWDLRNVPDGERTGAYVCAIACVFPDGREFTVRGEARGRILREYRGNGGFGYDPLFYFDRFGKTFAEISAAEKHSVSHRGEAIRLFAEKLRELI